MWSLIIRLGCDFFGMCGRGVRWLWVGFVVSFVFWIRSRRVVVVFGFEFRYFFFGRFGVFYVEF